MSLLPATSHINPSNPYWAADGPGISTVVGGAGITVTNGTGPTATIDNAGVNTITASGPGITASGTTAVALTNTGVTSVVAGSGIVVGPSTGAVTVSNQSFGDIWALGTIAIGDITGTRINAPISLGTQALAKPYEYAEGYGYLINTGGTCSNAPTLTVYLSSGSNPLPLDTTKAKGYVLVPQTPTGGITNLTGYYYDLSTIKHYDPAGFTSVTLTFISSFGGLAFGLNPTNSTSAFSNSTTTDVVVTKGTGLLTGAAGFKFFTSV
jgi:hypothetical protein